MVRNMTIRGWVPLLGVPAFFVVAFVLSYFPGIVDAPLCGVKLFIGLPCPGCGLTHAMVALAHGRIRSSIAYNPLGGIIALWLVYQFARAVGRVIKGTALRPLLSDEARSTVLYGFLIALFAQWILGLVIA